MNWIIFRYSDQFGEQEILSLYSTFLSLTTQKGVGDDKFTVSLSISLESVMDFWTVVN